MEKKYKGMLIGLVVISMAYNGSTIGLDWNF